MYLYPVPVCTPISFLYKVTHSQKEAFSKTCVQNVVATVHIHTYM